MAKLLYLAAIAALLIGAAHSILGERYILIRLFRRDNLPKLFGGTAFTKATLRFTWHITTIAFWGFAAILFLMAQDAVSFQNLAWAVAATFLLIGATALIASRGRHLSWIVFLFIGAVCWYAAVG
ncbi:MAG: hypothetical protein J5I94_02400 [Phaeodactylibacter sp.]|nr:hypothetical protein [Phaeodactylibacter sp.]